MYPDNTAEEIEDMMQQAWQAFHVCRKLSLAKRAAFMRQIAIEIENCGVSLIVAAMEETHLGEDRLKTERDRTIFQLNSYADFCESGQWLDVRIDTADDKRVPPKPDIRKMLVPLGPVVVFGAANFPFAYSTAGGDTACAFAAGCPVIVKAHPGHLKTSELVATAIKKAVATCELPDGIFAHVYGAATAVGEALVKHPRTKAVGFTGSFAGGKQLFDWGSQRPEPIPVFAEMSSVNPVFLFPEKMQLMAAGIARSYAASISLSVGQFCTNPGLLIGIENDDLQAFKKTLKEEIEKILPAAMLNRGIYKNFEVKKKMLLQTTAVEIIAGSNGNAQPQGEDGSVSPVIAMTSGKNFIDHPLLQQEVFGPCSLIVCCRNKEEMLEVAISLAGQLTSTLMATENDIRESEMLVDVIRNNVGRVIFNGVPTGVEVCLAMQHGGPFPATTDSRFTAVGGDGIKRFARPVAFQNWPDELLPDALKEKNLLQIPRMVNNEWQR